jgi:hypothetical protein
MKAAGDNEVDRVKEKEEAVHRRHITGAEPRKGFVVEPGADAGTEVLE